jgi:hypothetical protein
MVEVRPGGGGGQQDETEAFVPTPFLESPERRMAGEDNLVEIVHAGPAEGAVGHWEAGRFDDVRLDAEAGSETKDRARILGNIGLIKRDAQGQDCRHATTVIVAKLMTDK